MIDYYGNWLDRHVSHMTLEEKIELGRRHGVPHPQDPHPELAVIEKEGTATSIEKEGNVTSILKKIIIILAVVIGAILGAVISIKFVW